MGIWHQEILITRVLFGEVFIFQQSLRSYLCINSVRDFSGLSNLSALVLSRCDEDITISSLPPSLEYLDMTDLAIENIHINRSETFGDSLKHIFVSKPEICSCPQVLPRMFGKQLPHLKCTVGVTLESWEQRSFWGFTGQQRFSPSIHGSPRELHDSISSCNNLIDSPVLRTLLWTMCAAALFGNTLVVMYKLVLDKSSRGHSFWLLVVNLGLSDFLMGVYLLIIAGADIKFRGVYILEDDHWRGGHLCNLAGFITTLSSETSAAFILLITVDRYLVIRFPFREHHLSHRFVRGACCVVWMSGIIIAGLPLLIPDWEVYSFHSICVGLPLNSVQYSGSLYTVAIFIVLNSVIFVLIALGQASIIRAKFVSSSTVTSDMASDQAKHRLKEDIAIARRLSLIIITDFCCWFPICVMGLLARNGLGISSTAYAWTAVCVMPINSAINPLLYTAPTLTNICHSLIRQITSSRSTSS